MYTRMFWTILKVYLKCTQGAWSIYQNIFNKSVFNLYSTHITSYYEHIKINNLILILYYGLLTYINNMFNLMYNSNYSCKAIFMWQNFTVKPVFIIHKIVLSTNSLNNLNYGVIIYLLKFICYYYFEFMIYS